MSIVRFASLCDICGQRSAEYEVWPTCRQCGQDVCPVCTSPGSFEDCDDHWTAICVECAKHGNKGAS